MIKKKFVKRRNTNEHEEKDSVREKHLQATHSVKEMFDQNPDTSVYAKRYSYKKTPH